MRITSALSRTESRANSPSAIVKVHNCQPSRIRRDSPDFDYCVPMSRQTLQFSRQFIRRLSVRSFCPQQQVAHTRGQDTHALSVAMLTLAVEILSYAGREVRDSPPRDGPHTHTHTHKIQRGLLRACAFVPILVRNSRIETDVVPLCIPDRLTSMKVCVFHVRKIHTAITAVKSARVHLARRKPAAYARASA